jgi:hypothetical protein
MGFVHGSDEEKEDGKPRFDWQGHFAKCGLKPDRAFVTAWRSAVKAQSGYEGVIESLQEQGLTLETVLVGKEEIDLAERVYSWITGQANSFKKKYGKDKLPSVGGKGRKPSNNFEDMEDEFADLIPPKQTDESEEG